MNAKPLLGLGLLLCSLAGCVERRFIITTEPHGAIVYDEKGLPMGAAPADRTFTYYGKYRFTLVKDGCETVVVEENIRPPWYQWFLLDFVSENLIPFTLRDVRRFHYALPPRQVVPPEALLQEAGKLRLEGQAIGNPVAPSADPLLNPQAPPPVVVGPPVP